MDFGFTSLISIATLAIKYGPQAFALAEKFGPLATGLVKAVTPVVQKELQSGHLQSLGHDTVAQITGILTGLGRSLSPSDHVTIRSTISEAEQRQFDRASDPKYAGGA